MTLKKILALGMSLALAISVVPAGIAHAKDETVPVGYFDIEGYVETVFMTPDQAFAVCGDPDNTEVIVIDRDNKLSIAWDRNGWKPNDFDWEVDWDVDADEYWMSNHPPIFYQQTLDWGGYGLETVYSDFAMANVSLKDAGVYFDYDSYNDQWNLDFGDSGYDFRHSTVFSVTLENQLRDAYQDQYFIFSDMVDDHILEFSKSPTVDFPIYRLKNTFNDAHIYTANTVEKNILKEAGWEEELSPGSSAYYGLSVYRLNNPATGEILYSADRNECKQLSKKHGWTIDNDGQPVFYGTPDKQKPMYRLFNPDDPNLITSHHYTSDANEIEILTSNGWVKDNDGKPLWYLR